MLTQTKRPFNFDEMIGQKGIISEMKKRSIKMEFPEVMIFAGASGVGKTTLAYIVSAILNDPNPLVDEDGVKSPNPNSDSTISIREERFNRDTRLYDASSMGKEDVLQLGRSLANAPMYDKNKIIIIDEAQELSKAGKGVVLELLEKKRKGTYIILCTMNIESFDKAVRSRGHIYNFRPPTSSDIAEYLFRLAGSLEDSKEFTIPDTPETEEFFSKGLFMIAENCEGSVRMAVQNFERCLFGEFYTVEQIEQEFSIMSDDRLADLVVKLLSGDPECLKDILDFGAKDFYYKTLKMLITSYVYFKTGYIEEDWKKSTAHRLKDKDVGSVIPNLLEVGESPYFREDLFLYKIAEILGSLKRPPVTPVGRRAVVS